MAFLYAGSLIKEQRKQMGLTLEKLCDGICDISSLRRIESGQRTPSTFVFIRLMERLGFDATKYFVNITDKAEMNFIDLVNETTALLKAHKNEEARDKINALESAERLLSKNEGANIRKQMVMSAQCTLSMNIRGNKEQRRAKAVEALRLTIPNFDIGNIIEYLFTPIELSIIITLVNTYEIDTKVDIYYQLKSNMERYFFDESERAKKYTLILSNLANQLTGTGRYKEVLEICAIGISYCIKNDKLDKLPNFKFMKANALFAEGNVTQEIENLVAEAIYGSKCNENFVAVELFSSFAEEEMRLTLNVLQSKDDERNFTAACNTIRLLTNAGEYEQATEKINEIESSLLQPSATDNNRIRRQTIDILAHDIALSVNDAPEKRLEMVTKAIEHTMPAIDETRLSLVRHNTNSLLLYNALANIYNEMGDRERAINILRQVMTAVEDFNTKDDEIMPREYALIVSSLTTMLNLSGRYDDVLLLCDKAIQFCINYDTYRYMPHIRFNKACALFHTGDTKHYSGLAVEAVYSLKANEEHIYAEHCKDYARDVMGVNFPY